MRREQLVGYLVLGVVALFLGFTLVSRWHDGRCHMGGRRGGLDCTYSAGSR